MYQDDNYSSMAAPYDAAARREEIFQERQESHNNEIWDSFEDELEGAEFIRDNLADPEALLADVFQAVAIAKANLWKLRGHLPAAKAAQAVVMKDLYDKLLGKIDDHVEKEAGYRAENE